MVTATALKLTVTTGQFRPKYHGHFPPEQVVTLFRNQVVNISETSSIDTSLNIDNGLILNEIQTNIITERKGGKVNGSVVWDRLKNGAQILLKDSAGFKISALLDTLNNRLSISAESPSEKVFENRIERYTEHKRKIEIVENQSVESSEKTLSRNSSLEGRDSSSTEKVIIRPTNMSIIWVFFIFIILIIIYFFMRKKIGI
ncbi:hypothetical protein [Sphingobacterium sp.]|uniref:hypothetical protein n=1 Tax=Sphingobacterium sp. TaxID=341027 RepID=UPI002FDDAF35